jgi:mRNA interferase RelE/StbE
MSWKVEITTSALKQLQGVKDNRVRNNLFERIEELSNDPEKQGKPLREELSGLRCVRAIGQRYRIVYKVEQARVVVVVVAVGMRKAGDHSDIYQIAARLMRSGLIGFHSEGSKNDT